MIFGKTREERDREYHFKATKKAASRFAALARFDAAFPEFRHRDRYDRQAMAMGVSSDAVEHILIRSKVNAARADAMLEHQAPQLRAKAIAIAEGQLVIEHHKAIKEGADIAPAWEVAGDGDATREALGLAARALAVDGQKELTLTVERVLRFAHNQPLQVVDAAVKTLNTTALMREEGPGLVVREGLAVISEREHAVIAEERRRALLVP